MTKWNGKDNDKNLQIISFVSLDWFGVHLPNVSQNEDLMNSLRVQDYEVSERDNNYDASVET